MYTVQICDSIEKLTTCNSTVIIAIDGLGGAGKSTLSNLLYEELLSRDIPVTVLHIDDFIHPKSIRYNPNYEEWFCYYNLQWRYNYLIDQIITPIKCGQPLSCEIELYDKENDTYYNAPINITHNSVVIIEGIFLQRPELANVFDYTIYVDVPESVRLSRVLKRDGYIGDEEQIRFKYENRYFPAERHYFAACAPDKNADIVIKELL